MTRAHRRRDRHVPMRSCLGCGARRPRRDLVRFVARPRGTGHELVADASGRAHGRGLYTCRRRECFDRAAERRAFTRAARTRGPLALDRARDVLAGAVSN